MQQAEIDEGVREGVTSQELEQIRKLKAENARLREERGVPEGGHGFLRRRCFDPRNR